MISLNSDQEKLFKIYSKIALRYRQKWIRHQSIEGENKLISIISESITNKQILSDADLLSLHFLFERKAKNYKRIITNRQANKLFEKMLSVALSNFKKSIENEK